MYMKVSLLSDITDPDGNNIKPHIKNHQMTNKSKLSWSIIPEPPKKSWQIWKKLINYIQTEILIKPLKMDKDHTT